ncbi:secreted protein [Neisseria gonorrhoeae]|uniref:Secreted protein n=1 Tax=Neisseria gonorrhoeae TaxID=485 RepID=A0A378VZ14_NEIGO|nr:secreted protein [Neisseria gonorrhoeae]
MQKTGFLTVESHQYDRGWFTSTETTVIRLKPELLHNAQKYLPDNLKIVLEQPVTLVNHITHGPFAGGFGTQAHIETEFKYEPETEKVLERFFGKQVPVSLANTVYFNGSGKMEVSVPAFDYEELSGIRLHWEGLTGETVYQKGFKSYRNSYDAPLFKIKLADKGDAAFEKRISIRKLQTASIRLLWAAAI